ncbi:MAG: gfo/Idh/MocA family oxidoreductase [Actinobacteria bacterium]|nr:gfo/Idh/MocA family oxidoreductase [Actinomycetota bacterium]
MAMRWGIAGTGRIASDFARDLANIADAQLVAVGSRSIDSARTFASARNIPRAHGSVADLAQDPEVDVVYVAGIHPVHREHAIAMMRAGKHVLVEKPLAMNAGEVDEMLAVSTSTGRFLMEAMWMRFNPLHVELKRRIDAGEFGEVRSIDSDFSFAAERSPTHRLFDPAKGGGAVLDVGIYPITLAWWFLGEPSTWSATGEIGPTGVDERATIDMNWNDGRSAHLTCGSTHEGSTASTIECESATIVIPTRSHASNVAEIRTSSGTEQLTCDEPGLHHQVREVHRCIASGAIESPQMSHHDSRAISVYMDSVLDVLHRR